MGEMEEEVGRAASLPRPGHGEQLIVPSPYGLTTRSAERGRTLPIVPSRLRAGQTGGCSHTSFSGLGAQASRSHRHDGVPALLHASGVTLDTHMNSVGLGFLIKDPGTLIVKCSAQCLRHSQSSKLGPICI